jgi:hypothetical protein
MPKKLNCFTKEVLDNLYINKQLSIYKIAEMYGVSSHGVFIYLKKFNIKLRSRSLAAKLSFEDGQRNVLGKNNPQYKHGWYCGEKRCFCGNQISGNAEYCVYCANQIIGFNKQKHYFCLDCGKEIKRKKYKRCRDCWIEWSKISENNPMFGKRGRNTGNYIHGRGYEPYSPEFTEYLKEEIKKRDNYECQNCNMTEEEHLIVYGRDLEIHHIDYNKKNCKEDNLITTCKQCNIRANYNHDYWMDYYQNKIKESINA